MRIHRILKTAGFLSLLGISIYLSISLNTQLSQPKSRFPLVEMAETEGWCSSSSLSTYTIYISKETPFVLFETLGIDDPPHTNESTGTKGGYWANYPDVTPYFLAVIEDNGINKKFFAGGDAGNKKICVRMKAGLVPESPSGNFPPYVIVNLSENGLELSDAGIDEAIEYELTEVGAANWRGLYYALGFDDDQEGDSIESFKLALAETNIINGEGAIGNELEIVFDKDNPFQVVAIKTWNYEDFLTNLPIEFESFVQNQETDLSVKPSGIVSSQDALTVELNIDGVDLVREEIQRHIYLEDGSLENFVPGPGEHIDDRLDRTGRLVVAGIIVNWLTGEGRTYDEIIEILVDLALGNTAHFITGDLPSGGGADWLQVAAADIYNQGLGSEVFECVWEVYSDMPPNSNEGLEWERIVKEPLGVVLPDIPYRVYLNPFDEHMRFNKASEAYDFHCNKTRDSVIWHESLHNYTYLPGRLINDEEDNTNKINDCLFVKQGGGKTPYHTFSYDDKSRGFLTLHPTWEFFNMSRVKAYLHGYHGDVDSFFALNDDVGRFIIRIDDKLTEDDLKRLFIDGKDIVPDPFIDFGFPDDIPALPIPNIDAIDIRVSQEEIYLYMEPGIDVMVGYLLTNRSGQNTRVESDYGHYDAHDQEIIKIESWARPDSYPTPRVCFELLKRGMAKLYVTFIIRYWDAPEEYDASYFADISRGPRA